MTPFKLVHINLRSPASIATVLLFTFWLMLVPFIPAVSRLMGLEPWLSVPLGLACAIMCVLATCVFYLEGHESRLYQIINKLETITFTLAPAITICVSRNPANVFWVIYFGHLLQCASAGLTRFNFVLFTAAPLLMILWFFILVDVSAGLLMTGLGVVAAYTYGALARGATLLRKTVQERDQLQAELAKVHVHEERDRIARELHDGMGAELAALFWHVESLRSSLGEGDEATRVLNTFSERINMTTTELRNVVWELRATSLAWPALVAHLQTRCEELCGSTVRCQFTATGPPDAELAGDIRMNLARIIQEGVRNSVRHGRPSKLSVRLDWQPLGVDAVIADDGVGISDAALAKSSGGLRNMSIRVVALGGRFVIERLERGTCLRVHIPNPASAAPQGFLDTRRPHDEDPR